MTQQAGQVAPRSLVAVIDRIAQVDAEVGEALKTIRDSAIYTAPEAMNLRWNQAADALQVACPRSHPKHREVCDIFSGVTPAEGGGP